MSAEKSDRNWRERKQRPGAQPSSQPTERKSWRKRSTASGTAGATAARPTERVDPRRAIYRLRIGIGFLAMIFAMMIVAWLISILYQPRETPVIALRITYAAPQAEALGRPPNPQAEEDYLRLRELFNRASSKQNRFVRARNENFGFWEPPASEGVMTKDAFVSSLLAPLNDKTFRPGGPRKNVVLFYISAHGVLNERGEPCLLLEDSMPFASETWLPVKSLLEAIQAHPRFGRTSNVKKVICFDANRLLMYERIGLLHNGFADAVERAVVSVGDPKLFVLNSTSPGEVGWSSPILQGSAFGFFLAEGLNGYADLNNDERIQLSELETYLQRAVGNWTRRRRDASQHPVVFGVEAWRDKADFAVAYAGNKPPSLAGAVEDDVADVGQKLKARNQEVQPLSETYTRLLKEGAYIRDPYAWAALEQGIVELDALIASGEAYDQNFINTTKQVTGLLNRFAALPQISGYSLPFQHALTPDLEQRTQQRLVAWKAKPVLAEWKEPLDPTAAVDLAWTWLSENAGAAELQTALAMLDKYPAKQGPELIESHFLKLLAKNADANLATAEVQRALSVRSAAETTANISDLRAQYGIADEVALADQNRRRAEDALFIGSPALAAANQDWDAALAGYGKVRSVSEAVAEMYRLRDETYARAPSMIRWATLQAFHMPAQASLLEDVSRLVTQLHQLSRELDSFGSTDVELGIAPAVPTSQALRQTLDKIKSDYQRKCQNITDISASDQETLRRLSMALSMGTLEERINRGALRDRYLSLLLKESADLAEAKPSQRKADAESETGASQKTASDALLDAMLTLRPHPLFALLDRRVLEAPEDALPPGQSMPAAPTGSDKDKARIDQVNYMALQGALVRERLAALDEGRRKLGDLTRHRLQEAPGNGGTYIRQGLSFADRLTRASAGVLGGRAWDEEQDDPARQLWFLDQRQFFMWQGQRALDDFWGPTEANRWYFDQLAQSYLKQAQGAAQQVLRQPTKLSFQGTDLEQLSRERADAARTGIVPVTQNITVNDEEPYSPNSVAFSAVPQLPEGTAWLGFHKVGDNANFIPIFVRDSGDPAGLLRQQIQVGDKKIDPGMIEQRFRQSDLQVASLNAVTFYRGHTWSNPLYVTNPVGQQVVVARTPWVPPQVTVTSVEVKPQAIMIIFDCSYSMNDLLLAEKRKRIELAREAIPEVLKRLSEKQVEFHVGLTLYGHRVAIKQSGGYYRVPGCPEGLLPGEDVETLLHVNNLLTKQLVADVRQKLIREALGQTPLYFAIDKVVKEELLPLPRDQFARRVIAVTDGLNNQPADPDGKKKFVILKSDLKLKDWKREGIQVDIFGFDLESEIKTAGDRNQLEELKDIPRATAGKFYSVRTPAKLIEAIEESLKPGEFNLTEKTGSASDLQPLGTTWTSSPWNGPEKEFVVHVKGVKENVRDQNIKLEGGEDLRMDIVGTDLVHKRYEPGTYFVEQRTQNGLFDVRAGMPERSGDAVSFPVVIQRNPAEQFTARPRHVWAEITPIGTREDPNKVSPLFVFNDLEFLSRTPTPVLVFKATNWPQFANLAELRVWFRMNDDVTPNDEFTLKPEMPKTPFTAEGVKDVDFQIDVVTSENGDGQLVRVTEIHREEPVNLESIRVQMTPPPDEISHRFVPELQRVVHNFRYSGAGRGSKVQVTTRDRIVNGAEVLELPIRVTAQRK